MLGSGTSTGVPTLGCSCPVCTSSDPRDQRLRPSILLSWDHFRVVIDTTPDFRTQALRAGLRTLDAVLLTHSHADHIMGLDDIRPFNFDRAEPIPVLGDAATLADIRRVYKYVFDDNYPHSTIPRIATAVIDAPWEIGGVRFEPLTVMHGPQPILAYRFGRHAYVTDFSQLPPAAKARLRGLDVLFLDALRRREHPTHSTLENSLALVRELQPRRAFFTHICHELGHASTSAELPPGVALAYDGLRLDLDLSPAD